MVVVAATSMARKVSSWIEISETMAESLIRVMNCPASGGRVLRIAWGRMMSRWTPKRDRPMARAASRLKPHSLS